MAKVGVRRMQLVLDPVLEATRILEGNRQTHPNFADQRHLLGLLYLSKGEPEAALAEFEAALAVNAEYRRARFNRLVALRRRDGTLDPALWSQDGLLRGVAEPERSLWTAWFLAQTGDQTGVRSVLERLEELPAWTGLAHYTRALHEAGWGDAHAAQDALESAASVHPLYRSILKEKGWTRPEGRKGRMPAGWLARVHEQLQEELKDWNPGATDLEEYLGNLCARAGNLDEALGFYEGAFLCQGDESLHQVRLSQLALARGDEEEAVRTLARAIEVDPTSVAARIALGFEYQSQGYPEEALVQFEVAARLRPEYPDVQYNLGLLYAALSREEDAARCLRQALQANPRYFQARTTLAQMLIQHESWPEALAELGDLIEQGLPSADLHVQKAEVHLAMGEAQEAVEVLETAVALNPAYARTYYVLGQAYRQLGLKRKARSAWQQYLDRSRSWREEVPEDAWGTR